MTEQERKAKDAARKREAYARRKAEALANSLPDKSPQELAALRLAQANGINVQPTPEAEERWKRVQPGKIEPLSEKEAAEYVSNREKSEAVMAEAVAREEYVNHLFAKYAKTTNIPQLLAGILRETIETRVVMTDLLAEILKEMQK